MSKIFRKIETALLCMLGPVLGLTSCNNEETYAERKARERKAIQAFMQRDLAIMEPDGSDTLCYVGKIHLINEIEFEKNGFVTNTSLNEYVLFNSSGVYMQIVRQGVGEKLKDGEKTRVICRFIEYNIFGDSLQLRNDVPLWHPYGDILDVSKTSGAISASFNTDYRGGGAMYRTYGSTEVPNGWKKPLAYINLGRYTQSDAIAKVRLIVPHPEGQVSARKNMYPCFYEITYERMRN